MEDGARVVCVCGGGRVCLNFARYACACVRVCMYLVMSHSLLTLAPPPRAAAAAVSNVRMRLTEVLSVADPSFPLPVLQQVRRTVGGLRCADRSGEGSGVDSLAG